MSGAYGEDRYGGTVYGGLQPIDVTGDPRTVITAKNRWTDMAEHTFKQGDGGEKLPATLKDDDGAVDLSNATKVEFYMRNRETGNLKIDGRTITIVNAANGEVEVDFSAGDLDTPGVYDTEFVVTDTNGEKTWPNSGYDTIEVDEDA